MKIDPRKSVSTLLFALALLFNGQALASEELAKSKNCLACHSVENKIVGPSYKEVAAKYKDIDEAAVILADKIKNGGSGNWGNIPMPPQAGLTDDETDTLANWILSL